MANINHPKVVAFEFPNDPEEIRPETTSHESVLYCKYGILNPNKMCQSVKQVL